MLDRIADRRAKGEEQHLAACEECCTEYDVTDGPSVFEGAEDEDELRDNVDRNA